MTNIITLGPDGTYSSEATKNLILNNYHYKINYSTDNISTIESIEKGVIGIVPIENKYGGRVAGIIEKIYDKREYLEVGAWINLRIKHILATNGTPLESIKSIHAHPQSLLQCKKNIDKISGVKTVNESSNTSHISKIKDKEGVICSASAAEKNGLTIVDYDMAPEDNETHFIMLKHKEDELSDDILNNQNMCNKRVLGVLHTEDEKGNLANCLNILTKEGIGLHFILSLPDGEGGYNFPIVMDNTDKITSIKQQLNNNGGDLKVI